MPVPTPRQVTDLVGDVVAAAGAELDAVTVTAAGRRSVVRVVVDSDAGLELDEVAELSRLVSDTLDAAAELGEAPFTLEVTTPGVDRPLTELRHWRRARGRRVSVTLTGGGAGGVTGGGAGGVTAEVVVGRVGEATLDAVVLVLAAKGGPVTRPVSLTDVQRAMVEVEFSAPDPRELALSGAPASGAAPDQANDADPHDADLHDADVHDADLHDADLHDEETP